MEERFEHNNPDRENDRAHHETVVVANSGRVMKRNRDCVPGLNGLRLRCSLERTGIYNVMEMERYQCNHVHIFEIITTGKRTLFDVVPPVLEQKHKLNSNDRNDTTNRERGAV